LRACRLQAAIEPWMPAWRKASPCRFRPVLAILPKPQPRVHADGGQEILVVTDDE